MAASQACISIPVQESDELVVVSTAELPAEPEDLLELLKGELAPLRLWLDFAKAYLANDKVDAFLHILDVATGPEVEQYFAESRFERLQVHCALAAYHLSRAQGERARGPRAEALAKATAALNKAIAIDVNEQLPVLGLGQVALAKGDTAQAKHLFERAAGMTSDGRRNISGLLALAALTFQEERYREALGMYCRALREHPAAPAEVRLGLAACHFRLGSHRRARAAYERCLQLAPGCCEALLGLAVLSFNSPDAHRGLREGLQLLCRAYSANPLHPGVLNALAHFALLRSELAKARSLAGAAAEAAQTDAARAQALGLLARASHSAGAVQEAFRYYSQASALNPKAPLPLLGLAQINLLQKENTNAVTLLEKALQLVPGWGDALVVLGSLYPHMEGRKGKAAVEHFKRAAAQASTSSGRVAEMLGELLATSDPAGALRAYKQALALYREEQAAARAALDRAEARGNGAASNGDAAASAGAAALDASADGAAGRLQRAADALAVETATEQAGGGGGQAGAAVASLPARLLNNAAALHLRAGEREAALDLMCQAVEAAKEPGPAGLAARDQLTLGFNLARAKEAAGSLSEAQREYEAILKEFPDQLDCHFRLAWIAAQRGDHAGALRRAEAALEARPKDANALALIGYLHMQRREWKEAEDTFKELRQEPANKNDPYAMMALGAIPLNSLTGSRKKEDPAKVAKLLDISLKHFRAVLDKAEGNVFAAHGIAAALAESATRAQPPKLEYLIHAKKIFEKVRDAAASHDPWVQMPDLAENLGHVALAEGRTKDALQLYASVQRRHHRGTSAELQLLCARALYDEDGRRAAAGGAAAAGRPSALPEARTCLLKARHLDPTNYGLLFNLAFVIQELAVRTLKKPRPENDPAKAEEFEGAVVDLAMAHRTFFYLRNAGAAGVRVGIDDRVLESHILFCHDTHVKGQALAEKAAREAEALEAKRQQSRIELEAALAETRAREAALQRRDARRAAERDEKARAAQQRLQQLQASWAEAKAVTEAAAAGDAIRADKRRKKKSREDAAVDAIFGGEDSDDGGDYNPWEVQPDGEPAAPEGSASDSGGGGSDGGGGDRADDPLKGTGLESDDDEAEGLDVSKTAEARELAREAGAPPSSSRREQRQAAAAAAAPPSAPASGARGRLKRLRGAEPGAAPSDAPPPDATAIFGEESGGEAAGSGGEDAPPAPKRRAADLFGDSDDDE